MPFFIARLSVFEWNRAACQLCLKHGAGVSSYVILERFLMSVVLAHHYVPLYALRGDAKPE